MMDQVQIPCAKCGGLVRVPVARLNDGPHCPRCHDHLLDGHPIEINASAAFDRQLLKSELPLVVDFWAPWCGPCRMMAPTFERASQTFKTQARFLKVNTDEVGDVAGRYNIRSIPTMIVFAAGREAARVSGALNPQQMERWLRGALGMSTPSAQQARG